MADWACSSQSSFCKSLPWDTKTRLTHLRSSFSSTLATPSPRFAAAHVAVSYSPILELFAGHLRHLSQLLLPRGVLCLRRCLCKLQEAWLPPCWLCLHNLSWYAQFFLFKLGSITKFLIVAGIGLEYVLLVSSGVFYFILLALIESSLFRTKSDGKQRTEDTSDSMFSGTSIAVRL